jgi:1,4-alpha-glucan branching enzyme
MKPDYHHATLPIPDLHFLPVQFDYTHPTATSVSIAGTFNNWHPTTKSMHPAGNGCWQKEAFLPPGDYEYCLVVDGRWIPDPHASDSVPNSFGGRNSIYGWCVTPPQFIAPPPKFIAA